MESAPTNIEDDLNSVRSQVKRLIYDDAAGNWFDDIPTVNSKKRAVSDLNTDLDDLEEKRLLCPVQILTDVTVAAGVAATGTLTSTANFANGETVTIDAKVYTFQTVLTDVDGNVNIGGTQALSMENLRRAINLDGIAGTDYATSMTLHPTVSATDTATTTDVTAKKAGTFGNSIATTETAGNASWGGATLSGGSGGDVVVLSVAGSEAPTDTAAIGTGLGAVVAVLATDVGAADLTEIAGANALAPKNLIHIRDAATKNTITSAGGNQIFGLLQAETGVVQDDTFDDATKQVQITFVENDGSDDLTTIDGADLGGTDIEYLYMKRITLDTLSEDCVFPLVQFSDQTALVDVTRQRGYDNQGTTPVDVTTNSTLDLESAGVYWEIRDDLQATLFRITEGSAGGTTVLLVGSDVDTFDVNAAVNDFANGVSMNSGGTRPIDVGVNDGVIESTAGDLRVAADPDGTAELYFDDSNQTGSTWAQTDGVKLSETTAEWDAYEAAFGGEVSLLNAIVQANTGGASRAKAVAVVTAASIAADTNVTGTGGGTNLDANLCDYSALTFVDDVDVFLNGVLMRNGADATANHDVYPGDTPANGDLKFEFVTKINDQITTICWTGL